MSSLLERLEKISSKLAGYELTRKENLECLKQLFFQLGLNEKVGSFETIFSYKALNISAVSLQNESFGVEQEGKYLQILAITRVNGKSKNISLAYFGRIEQVEEKIKKMAMEFVIRYRFEKSFITLEGYHAMLGNFDSCKEQI